MSVLGTDAICQVGIVVRDIERTARRYAALFGVDVPPIHVTDPEEKTHVRYRGEPTAGRAKLTFFRLGAISLELIEPIDGPSTWQEFLDTHGEGVHHIAFRVSGMNDVIRRLEDQEMPVVQQGEFTGGRYAYIDSAPQLGVILELLEHD